MVFEVRPMLSTVSIMPGIEILAPERTDRSSGFFGSQNFFFMTRSVLRIAASTWAFSSGG